MTKKELIDILCNIPKKKDFDKMYNYITNLQQENKELKDDKKKAIEYIKINIYENVNEVKVVNANELLELLGDKE